MRRLLIVFVISLTVISASYAAETTVMAGGESGFSQLVMFSNDRGDRTGNIVPIKMDALFYLGNNFALNTTVGMDIYLPQNKNMDTFLGLSADVFAYYRLPVTESISFLAGGGLSYRLCNLLSFRGENSSAEINLHMLALLASARLQFGITENIFAFASADIGYNVLNITSERGGGVSGSGVVKGMNAMPWAINAGVNYKF